MNRSQYIKPRYVMAYIKRDMTETLTKICFEHEFEILREIHGEGNVTYKLPEELPREERKHIPQLAVPISASDEYSRLELVYDRHAEKKMTNVEAVYGRFGNEFIRAAGGAVDYTPPREEDADEDGDLGLESNDGGEEAYLPESVDEVNLEDEQPPMTTHRRGRRRAA